MTDAELDEMFDLGYRKAKGEPYDEVRWSELAAMLDAEFPIEPLSSSVRALLDEVERL